MHNSGANCCFTGQGLRSEHRWITQRRRWPFASALTSRQKISQGQHTRLLSHHWHVPQWRSSQEGTTVVPKNRPPHFIFIAGHKPAQWKWGGKGKGAWPHYSPAQSLRTRTKPLVSAPGLHETPYSNKPSLLLIIVGLFRINFRALSECSGLRSNVVSDAAPQTFHTKTQHIAT